MVNIVLVEPEIPQNAGNIVRTCAAIGANLYMVRPLGFEMDEKHFRRAHLDYDLLANVYVINSIKELWQKYPDKAFFYASTKSKKTYDQIEYPDN